MHPFTEANAVEDLIRDTLAAPSPTYIFCAVQSYKVGNHAPLHT